MICEWRNMNNPQKFISLFLTVLLAVFPAFADGVQYLGVEAQDLSAARAASLHVGGGGIEVLGVEPGSPAAAARLRAHDVIVSFNGLMVDDHAQLLVYLSHLQWGAPLKLGLVRDGQPVTVILSGSAPLDAVGTPAKPLRNAVYTQPVNPAPAPLPTISAAKPSAIEGCAKGVGESFAATGAVTAIMCLADFFFSAGILCGTYLATAAAHAPIVAAAGCAVGGLGASAASTGIAASQVFGVQ